MLMIPHCLESRLTDGSEDVSLTRRSRSTSQKYIFQLQILISLSYNNIDSI
jgi:hypothetical protein